MRLLSLKGLFSIEFLSCHFKVFANIEGVIDCWTFCIPVFSFISQILSE